MQLNKTTLLGLLFSSIISAPTLAIESIYTECKTCETDNQFDMNAKNNSILNNSIFVNVMNFENNEIRKFKALKSSYRQCSDDNEPNGKDGRTKICQTRYNYSVTPESLTSLELNKFDNLASEIIDLKLFVSSHKIKIPKAVVESGYQIIGTSYIETKAETYFNNLPLKDGYKEKVISTGIAASMLIGTGHLKLNFPPVVFEFSDKIKAYAAFDFYDMDDQIHFTFTKIVDANGNEFDLTKPNPFSTKTYNFSGVSKTSWSQLYAVLNAYGLGVRGASESLIPKGTVTIIPCSNCKDDICKSPN